MKLILLFAGRKIFMCVVTCYFWAHRRANPSARKSGCNNFRGVPASERIASAAKKPLRTAPSIVDGQPVEVQSPARNNPVWEVPCGGRHPAEPGAGENVADISFTTVPFTSDASRVAGSTLRNSSRHRAMISWRERVVRL